MNKSIFSESGREYELTYNQSMDICIIMDCMTPEALNEEFEGKQIYYNYAGYVHGELEDFTYENMCHYLEEYEKKLIIKGFEYEAGKEFEVYKGI